MQTKTLLSLLPAFLATTASACTGPPVNIPTLDLIKGFEGFHADAYDDGFGNPTIGFGHLCADPACSDVPFPKPLSDDSATKLLAGDLAQYQDALTNALADPVKLNDNQYGALVSWTFNNGIGNMQKSDLVKDMNAGQDVVEVANRELPLWNKANGKVVEGLTRRRKAEQDLFNAPSNIGALPVAC